ncbi:carbonic anhydrase [candidate division KSB1 bacterium]
MSFCTIINCIDGRIQIPVIKFLQTRFQVLNVDNITEPGPNLLLSEQKNELLIKSILKKVSFSIEKHASVGLAVVGHYDCSGNPATKKDQIIQLKKSIRFLKQHIKNIEIIGLWVDNNWKVNEVV